MKTIIYKNREEKAVKEKNQNRKSRIPAVILFLAILTVIGTLFSDIMYSVVDPRVKLGK